MTSQSNIQNVSYFNVDDKKIVQEFYSFFDRQISIGALGRKLPALMMSLVNITPIAKNTDTVQWTACLYYDYLKSTLNLHLLTDNLKSKDYDSRYREFLIELDFDLENSKSIIKQWFSRWKFSYRRAFAFASTFENDTDIIIFKGEYVADMPFDVDGHNASHEEICRFQAVRSKKQIPWRQRLKTWFFGSSKQEGTAAPILQQYTLTKKAIDTEPRFCGYTNCEEAHKDPIIV